MTVFGRLFLFALATGAHGQTGPVAIRSHVLGEERSIFVARPAGYETGTYRLLAGHSLGGLFALHALMAKPKLFNAYAAIDPSLEWNNGGVVAQAEAYFSKTKDLQADCFLTASNRGGKVPSGARRLASIPLRSIHQGLDTIFDLWQFD